MEKEESGQKPATPLTVRQLRRVGWVTQPWSFERAAAIRTGTAQRWVPRLSAFIRLSAALTVVCSLVSVTAVFMRPPRQVLLSLPDGQVRCALPSINLATGRAVPLSSQASRLCAQLSSTAQIIIDAGATTAMPDVSVQPSGTVPPPPAADTTDSQGTPAVALPDGGGRG